MVQRLTGTTKLAAVIASPISHSSSPMIHNSAYELLGLDYAYLAFDINKEQVKQTLDGFKAMNIAGCNVSMPLKQEVMQYLDEIDEVASRCNAVNTIVYKEGKLKGYNTDGIGFMQSLEDKKIVVENKEMVLLGSGGAATAILVQASISKLKKITVFIRNGWNNTFMEKIEEIKKWSGMDIACYDTSDLDTLKKVILKSDLLVNATSVGMAPNQDACIIPDKSYLKKDLCVVDIIYNPIETKLLTMARQIGCVTMNGKWMLLFQGAVAFEYFTGHKMPIKEIKKMMEIE